MNPIIEADSEGSNAAAGEEMLTDHRGKPVPPERIYLEEASLYRPIVTGDIFCIGCGSLGGIVIPRRR